MKFKKTRTKPKKFWTIYRRCARRLQTHRKKRVQQYYDISNTSKSDNTTQALAALSLENDRPNISAPAEISQQKIGQDMWKQLERVSVPKFNGSQFPIPAGRRHLKSVSAIPPQLPCTSFCNRSSVCKKSC